MSKTDYYHNKGQEDASQGKYKPPHGLLEDLLDWTARGMKKIAEENSAYNEGWRHAKDQTK